MSNGQENIFQSPRYAHYIIQYQGEYKNDLKDVEGVYIIILNEQYAILSVSEDIDKDIGNIRYVADFINRQVANKGNFIIVYILPPSLYTLQEISAIQATQVDFLQVSLPLNLTGHDVVVGIIDTGIDYLNEEFTDEKGKTRINQIWDQTIEPKDGEKSYVPFGTVYNRDEIDRAIEAKRRGEDPYKIVPSVDKIGHGTNMAGIVGASGKNPLIKGVAPECEFVIIKMVEAIRIKQEFSLDTPVFNITSIFAAIEYLRKYLLVTNKPVCILLPLGSNNGDHRGTNILDSYIESVCSINGIVLVTGAGNEGAKDGHASGLIKDKNRSEIVDLIIAEGQKSLFLEIWIELPNIAEVNIIAPSGEETGVIPAILNISKKYSFIFEQTRAEVYYYLPEEYSGAEMIRIYFYDLQPGIWKLTLGAKLGENIRYDAWILQSDLVKPGTRFVTGDNYGTVTTPGDSDFVITVAAYNQNNNNLLSYSGVAFREDYSDKVDFAAGGVNTMTVGLDNKIDVINGTSLSAAIGAGACVLLFQWGVVDGNYRYMYSQSMKTFLTRGTKQRPGDEYPNPHLGYGLINFYEIFSKMNQ